MLEGKSKLRKTFRTESVIKLSHIQNLLNTEYMISAEYKEGLDLWTLSLQESMCWSSICGWNRPLIAGECLEYTQGEVVCKHKH